MATSTSLGNVLVIGGCGFLGHHIVSQLHDTFGSSFSCNIFVLDLTTARNRHSSPAVSYHDGDITSLPALLELFSQIKPNVVIHTASPTLMSGSNALYRKVNVEGTRCVVEACQQTGVKALVYTSSASVVSDNATDLINANEAWPVIPAAAQTEYYSLTKAEAESLVLAANRSSILTCAIRPAGIFGRGDVQVMPNIVDVYFTGKTGFQLGNNENLFDFTHVANVAHAHILAAKALVHTASLSTAPLSHEKVDGEAFFITNDSPVSFWDFARAAWAAAGSPLGTEHVWVISRDFGLAIGGLLEWLYWGLGKTPKLTRRQVKYSCMTRYYDITKAKSRLGYRPIVELQDGIQECVEWFVAEMAKKRKFIKE